MITNSYNNKSYGFTLIEIIAVLIIIAIFAAVAVPKYLDMELNAKVKAAEVQVAEIKSTLKTAWAKYMARTSGYPTPTGQTILTEAGLIATQSIGVQPDDWTVTTSASGNVITIGVTARGGDTEYIASDTWSVPQ